MVSQAKFIIISVKMSENLSDAADRRIMSYYGKGSYMSKSERILNMYDRLLDGALLNKANEARRFGVDTRTIQRDIDDKKLYKPKMSHNITKQEQINKGKTFSSNELYESDNRISFKNENRLLFLNKRHDNSNSKTIKIDIPFKEKEKNCIVY